jgi:hypothetical protein
MAGNLATLQTAPRFTPDNAAEMGRRSAEARAKASAERKLKEIQRSNPTIAQNRVMKQIARVLTWMDKESDKAKHGELAVTLDRLWKLAYPTQGAVKSRGSRQQQAQVEPLTPQ